MTIDAAATLIYLGEIDRYPREKQIEDCHKAVKELGLPAIGRSIYECSEFDALRGICRGNEAVLLPRLDVLAERKGRGIGTRFLINLLKLTNETMIIMDVHACINSREFNKWYEHAESTRNRLVNSRNVTSDHAKLLGQLRHTKPGIVEHWTEYADRDVFKRMAQHWRDPKHKNAKAAIDSFPDDELRKASRKTVERIFGTRTVKRQRSTNKS